MDTLKRLHEKISALADGELADSELELALAALASADGQAAWRMYHLIGDALRGLPGDSCLDDACAQRLAARLSAEPALAACAPVLATASNSAEPGGALPDAAVTMP